MHFGHALVIAAEKGDEVLREVIFVGIGQRAHDAEIQRDIAPVARHQHIAGMHVGVEEAVAEHLGVENLHAVRGQLWNVDARRAQAHPRWLIGNAVHALHHHHFGRSTSPSTPPAPAASWHLAKLRLNWLALAASRIRSSSSCRCFSNSATTSAVSAACRLPTSAPSDPAQISSSATSCSMTLLDAGTQDFHRHLAPVRQHGEMHLRHRSAGDRRFVETREHLAAAACRRCASSSATACAEGNGGT